MESNASWLAAVIESADDAIFSTTPEGLVVSWNPGAERLFGYTAAEMIGRPVTTIFPSDRLAEAGDLLVRLGGGQSVTRYETVRQRKDGRTIDVFLTVSPIRDAAGRLVGTARIARDLTPRKGVTALLEERHLWLEGMLTTLGEGVVAVDPGGRVKFLNSAAEALTGWRREDAVDRAIDSVLWLVDEATRRRLENPVIAALAEGAPKSAGQGALVISADGTESAVEVSAAVIHDESGGMLGAIVLLRDVTELRRASQTQSRLAAIVDSSDDAIVSKTLEGIVLSWNPAAERLFGYTAAEMIGRPMTTIFPPDLLAEEADFLGRLARGERVEHFETVRVRKGGAPVDVSVTLSPIRDAGGRVIAVSKIARDITDRRRVEQERGELLRREQAAHQESLTVNRLKDEFIATLSHELRTPINAITGWANLLASGRLSAPEVAKAVDVIVRNAALQAQLINDLMDLSAAVVGKMRLEIRPLDLVRVVETAVESIRPSAATKELTLELRLEDGPVEVLGDPDRLQQIVWNLLTNALKFTPNGGRIEVRLERHAAFARLVVTDSGVGIAPDVLPSIFDRFQQADASTTRRHGGLGLGLAIARHLVELHGGSIWADSEGVGCGARFTLELGLLRDHAHHIPALAADARGATEQGRELAGLRILVVDDDESSRQLVGQVLSLAGATVVEAASASDALFAARRGQFDVVISDIAMPETDGYTLMRALRRGGRPPFSVALTAFATEQDRERARRAGFQAHVAKPVLPRDLVREVTDLVRGSGAPWTS
jgi:PAS domain S-box-containing protein